MTVVFVGANRRSARPPAQGALAASGRDPSRSQAWRSAAPSGAAWATRTGAASRSSSPPSSPSSWAPRPRSRRRTVCTALRRRLTTCVLRLPNTCRLDGGVPLPRRLRHWRVARRLHTLFRVSPSGQQVLACAPAASGSCANSAHALQSAYPSLAGSLLGSGQHVRGHRRLDNPSKCVCCAAASRSVTDRAAGRARAQRTAGGGCCSPAPFPCSVCSFSTPPCPRARGTTWRPAAATWPPRHARARTDAAPSRRPAECPLPDCRCSTTPRARIRPPCPRASSLSSSR